jgi:hypothetical protein
MRDSGAEIVLTGPPRSVSAVIPLFTAQRIVPIALQLAGSPEVHNARVRPFGRDASEIRLRLPRATPPGSYRGQATVAGVAQVVVAVVEPELHLELQPGRSDLSAAAGSRVEFSLELTNGGNVAFDVPAVVTFDLDDSDDQSRALGRALRAELQPGERRIDRLFEELRVGHGGEARVSLGAGKGPLSPGEVRRLGCVLEVPAMVESGRSYDGAWQLADATHVLLVTVKNGTRTREVTGA